MGRDSMRQRLARIIRPAPRSEVEEELSFHLEALERRYRSEGLSEEEARAAARRRMGELSGVREECTELLAAERRVEARREWFQVSWLDFKLGFRMLAKYPGLTIVGGLAMAFAIWIGAGTFEFIRQVVSPGLPLDDGHRVVGILVTDAEGGGTERQVAADFVRWRGDLETIEQLGAFRMLARNLITADGIGEPVEVAELTASGFDVARVAPLMGRTLLPADEAPGAPPVLVLGHDVWQKRFEGDPAIVGKTIRLGGTQPTVVGVMPAGFRFPVDQNLWMPLPRQALEHEPRQGPAVFVFGRLAPGASLAEAQAELTMLGERAAADFPETHEHLVPQVLPYAKSIFYVPSFAAIGLGSINLFVVMLLVLICGNVALLMFARAATRESELLVRNALGASRRRIISQLFVEALVLGALAAALGLAAVGAGLRWMYGTLVAELQGDGLPFWFDATLSTGTIVYSVLLTLLAAAVAGVVPALKVTGPKVEARLREMGAGGGGLRFGGVWTGVIVAQIAVTVVFPLLALMVRGDSQRLESLVVNFPDREYLAVRLEMDSDAGQPGSAFEARFRAAAAELEQRVEALPGVAGMAFGDRLPRMYHPYRLVELDAGPAAPMRPEWPAYRVSNVHITPDFFDELQVAVRNGRGLHSGDLGEDVRTVMVNESFVTTMLGGANPVGRRIRYVGSEEGDGLWEEKPEPWYEIVGVVPDMGLSWSTFDTKDAGIYHPVAPGGVYPMHAAVHVPRAEMGEVLHEIRAVATRVDPALRIYEAGRMDRLDDSEIRFYSFWFWIIIAVSGVAVVLSLAGIYAAMSFAVARRTREIGIRVALGAGRGRVIGSIFRRPLIQVGLGLLVGGVLIATFAQLGTGNLFTPARLAFLGGYMAAAAAVCMLACIVPTRRALAVEPMEALRGE